MIIRSAQPVYFLPAERLPRDFRYPEAYNVLVASKPYCVGPVNEDWCFIDAAEMDAFVAYAHKIVPSRPLVPFMRRNGDDGVACFDGKSVDGNPTVYEFNYCVDIGSWGGELTFPEWLALIPAVEDDE